MNERARTHGAEFKIVRCRHSKLKGSVLLYFCSFGSNSGGGVVGFGMLGTPPSVLGGGTGGGVVVVDENLVMAIYSTRDKQPGPCKYVPGTRRQNHQCRRDTGLPDAIKEARRLAVHHCEEQFRYDRWNCTIETKGKRNLFRKVMLIIILKFSLTTHALA